MKKRVISIVTAAALLTPTLSIAGTATSTAASVSGNILSFGTFRYRNSVSGRTITLPISVAPPRLSVGCGGIDIALGGISFAGFEKLINNLDALMTAATSYAFKLALKTVCSTCEAILSDLQAIADAINSLNFDACDAVTQIGDALVGKFASEGAQDANDKNAFADSISNIKRGVQNMSGNGLVKELADKIRGTGVANSSDEVEKNSKADPAEVVYGIGSMMWNLAQEDNKKTLEAFIPSFHSLFDKFKDLDKFDKAALMITMLGDAQIDVEDGKLTQGIIAPLTQLTKLLDIAVATKEELQQYKKDKTKATVKYPNSFTSSDMSLSKKDVEVVLVNSIDMNYFAIDGLCSTNKETTPFLCLSNIYKNIITAISTGSKNTLTEDEKTALIGSPLPVVNILNELGILAYVNGDGDSAVAAENLAKQSLKWHALSRLDAIADEYAQLLQVKVSKQDGGNDKISQADLETLKSNLNKNLAAMRRSIGVERANLNKQLSKMLDDIQESIKKSIGKERKKAAAGNTN